MRSQARVVVIGGGIAGVSTLWHLAQAGWQDLLLLEKAELTSGSTWHAAGNTPTFSGSWPVMRMQAFSLEMYRRLAADPAHGVTYHVTGSLRLAQSQDRLNEFRHVTGMARAQGLEFQVLSPAEAKERYPFLELHGLTGALLDPLDGDIDPSMVTQALAAEARAAGAEIRRNCPVTAITRGNNGYWQLSTPEGVVEAEHVVNATGYRAAELGAMVGLDLPVVTMEHQYLVTEAIPELEERPGLLPLLRDPDDSYYLRQERKGLLLGPYEKENAKAAWLDGLPEDFANQLWNDDLERLEKYIELACARVPILGSVGVRRVVSGPIPYTPDGLPLLGPAHGLTNFWHCAAFSFGICQGGGAGKIVADWITQGEPEWDVLNLDSRRFTGFASKSYTLAKALELYENEYEIGYPVKEWPAHRPMKTSPLYDVLKAEGARFGARGGWERPTFFGPKSAETPSFRRPGWHELVGEEVRAVHEHAGLLDLPGFTKLEVNGPQAAAFLDLVLCSRLPRPGRVSLAYALTPQGGIRSEFTVARLAEDRFYLCSASTAQHHDFDTLAWHLPANGVAIADVTARFDTLVLTGPRSREVMAAVTDLPLDNAAFPWMAVRRATIGSAPVVAMRLSYAGELGYELHVPMEHVREVYGRVKAGGRAFGLRHFGIYALESMRLEKCYRSWGADLVTEYTPFEAGLDRFVDLAKPGFVGRERLIARKEAGLRDRFVPLLLEDGDSDAVAVARVLDGDQQVGLVGSAGFGHRIGRSIALAYVARSHAEPGTRLGVEVLGERRAAVVASEPLFDPENLRLRG
ncbi:GcvT family protein [Geminicoccus flavidas]|uniref:GcvT family protein n=1 Tax=Geminicoccus flavidas TaxID=2506407 RepID=UPI00135C2CFF|nr:FAD-dependent oxidoreductase [Geminicoccus flavidas]